MCDTASLELSKELFQLSGWDYMTHAWLSPFDDPHPVYDLGYLLRKLPKDFHLYPIPGAAWQIQYWSRSIGKEIIKQADTPEDAACLLAIELFQQGILKREQE